jgi:hypothetical protein
MVETAIATWTTAAIAGILPLHACPARVGHGVDAEPPSLRSAPCLPLESSKLLRATQAGSQPDADQRNSNISSASAARLRPLCSPEPTLASDPVGIRRRIDAGLDRHRHSETFRLSWRALLFLRHERSARAYQRIQAGTCMGISMSRGFLCRTPFFNRAHSQGAARLRRERRGRDRQ